MYFNAPRLQQRVPIKKISWWSMPPNPPSKLTAAPLDRQISVFIGKTQSHACIVQATRTPAMGVRDHVSCEHFGKLEQFGALMHILKTFVLIHFRFYLLINTDIE